MHVKVAIDHSDRDAHFIMPSDVHQTCRQTDIQREGNAMYKPNAASALPSYRESH